jgi:hypothetical protein
MEKEADCPQAGTFLDMERGKVNAYRTEGV